jgi:hypothetical protein
MGPRRKQGSGARYNVEASLLGVKTKQTSLAWPHPVDERLEAMVDAAIDAGERTDRREILAALVSTTDVSGAALAKRIRKYRGMDVGEVLPGPDVPPSGEVELPNRPPGRRPGRAGKDA